jgi:hypothetical protein
LKTHAAHVNDSARTMPTLVSHATFVPSFLMQHLCQVFSCNICAKFSHATFVPSFLMQHLYQVGQKQMGGEGLVLLMIIIVGTQTQKLTKVNKSKH